MNEIQKSYLSSADYQIRAAALKLAIYEILTGKEDFHFWQLLKLQPNLSNVFQMVLKEYPRNAKMFDKFMALIEEDDTTPADKISCLLSAYITTPSKKIKAKLRKQIDNVVLSNVERLFELLEVVTKTSDFDDVIKDLLEAEGENLNVYIRAIKNVPTWVWEKISHFSTPQYTAHILSEVVKNTNKKNAAENQKIIFDLVMKNASFVSQFHYVLSEVLFKKDLFDVNWRYNLLLQLIEKGKLSKDIWNEWIPLIADLVFKYTRLGTPVEKAWDKLEHTLILRWKHDKKQGLFLLLLVDKIARKMAFLNSDSYFVWNLSKLSDYNSGVQEVLKYELALIKQVLEFPEPELSGYLQMINIWLINFRAGKVLEKKRRAALERLKEIKLSFTVFLLEETMGFCPAVSESNRADIETFYNRIVLDNPDLFLDKKDIGIDLVVDFANYCQRQNLEVIEFKKRYAAEVNSYHNELRNKERILAELALPLK